MAGGPREGGSRDATFSCQSTTCCPINRDTPRGAWVRFIGLLLRMPEISLENYLLTYVLCLFFQRLFQTEANTCPFSTFFYRLNHPLKECRNN